MDNNEIQFAIKGRTLRNTLDEVDTSDKTWLECFIDKNRFAEVLSDPTARKLLPRLCVQFTEKALISERERDLYMMKKLPPEEIAFSERKAAFLWLCGLACFAALDWDFDVIIDSVSKYDLLTLRALIDQSYKMYEQNKLDASFGNWLFYRWVLSLDKRYRIPQPTPKATVAHQAHHNVQADPAYQRHEKVLRMVNEFREHLPKARAFLTELVEQPKDILVPGVKCFLNPFSNHAVKSLNLACLGDRDVLVELQAPDFSENNTSLLPAADVANKCRIDLVCFAFTNGDYLEAKRLLIKIAQPISNSPLVAVNAKELYGYGVALGVTTPFSEPKNCALKNVVYDQKILVDDKNLQRRSELFRRRAEIETTGSLQMVVVAENAARCVIDGKPECIREKISAAVIIERFVKALKRQMDGVRSVEQRTRIHAYLQYLCAMIRDLKMALERTGYDVTTLRDTAVPTPKQPMLVLPSSEITKALIQSNDPWWKLLTKFKLAHLMDAVQRMNPYWHPQTLPNSEFLNSIVVSSVQEPTHNLQRLLLGKLEQLVRIRNYKQFTERLSEYITIMINQNNHAQRAFEAAFEAMRAQAEIVNSYFFVSNEWRRFDINTAVFAGLFKLECHIPDNAVETISMSLAALLNLEEFKMVLEKAGNININSFPMIPIARLLGAYGDKHKENSTARKCADAFSKHVTPKLINAQPRGQRRAADGSLIMDAAQTSRDEVAQMVRFFAQIRHPQIVAFLLAFAVSLHNRLVVTAKKPHLKIYAQLLTLYGNDNTPMEYASMTDIKQSIRILCESSLKVSRTNEDALRTFADFHYVEGEYQQAALRYIEYFAAKSVTLRPDTNDNTIFHDSIMHRLRLSLAQCGYLTLSFISCQYLKVNRLEEYRRAALLLRNNEARDTGASCSPMIVDQYAVEILSDIYHNHKQNGQLELLYAGGSSLSANKNVRQDLLVLDKNRRTSKFLRTLAAIYFSMQT